MALIVKDRIKESTNTTGTGTLTLTGATAGFQTFAAVGNLSTTYYAILNGNNWEVGLGTYTASGTTLSRDTVLSSSNAGAALNLSGGSDVFCTYPSEKAVFLNSSDVIEGTNIVVEGNIAANAVTTDKIATNAVTADKIAANAVTTDKIINDAVTTNKIVNDAVTTDKLNLVSTASTPSLEAKGSGTQDGYIQLNCYANTHGIKLKSPPHSAGANYTLTFPTTDGGASEFLQTNGSGVLTWAAATDTTYSAGAGLSLGGTTFSLDIANDQTWTGSQRGYITIDADLSFDQNAGNNFSCTPTATGTLTFSNHTAGQSGYVLLDNSGGHAITAAGTTKINATDLATISVAGVYLVSYFDNGTNAYLTVSAAYV